MNRRNLLAVVMAVALAGCGTAVESTPTVVPSSPAPSPTPTVTPAAPLASPTVTPTVTPTTALVAADLDGVLTSPDLAHRLPLVVAIDDNRAARPQSGFNATSLVWQAPADGYESRYLLLFQELDADDIGPVRSARIYSAHWAAEVRGAFAHYGGDLLSRTWMSANAGKLFTNVDGLGAGNPAYHRIRSRVAPHNAYTSTADLWRVAARLGGAPTFEPRLHVRPFRDDSPEGDRGASQTLKVPYNTVKVSYTYDSASNRYLRFLDGKRHIDPLDGQQVTARTVIVLFMKFRTDKTIEPGYNRPVLGYTGSGLAKVFMEGRVVNGTWTKAGIADPTIILGPDGEELALIRGRIFIQVVPIGTNVTVGS